MPIAAIIAIVGLAGAALAAIIGAVLYLLTLTYNIGSKVSQIDTKLEGMSEKLSYIPQLFHIAESHGNRITKVETKLDIETSNGAWHDKYDR